MIDINSIFYMYSNMDGRSQILIFLIVLVALMLISILIINFITKRKEEKYDKQFNSITRYSQTILDEEKNTKKEEIKLKTENEDIEVIEVIDDDNSIENISNMIEKAVKDPKIDLEKFETEEERDAIISYDELVKRAGAKKIVYKTKSKEEIKEDTSAPEEKKFKASQIVSPIYGIQKENKVKDDVDIIIDLEEFNVDNKNDEMQNDMEFLGSLKTFRSNLD